MSVTSDIRKSNESCELCFQETLCQWRTAGVKGQACHCEIIQRISMACKTIWLLLAVKNGECLSFGGSLRVNGCYAELKFSQKLLLCYPGPRCSIGFGPVSLCHAFCISLENHTGFWGPLTPFKNYRHKTRTPTTLRQHMGDKEEI